MQVTARLAAASPALCRRAVVLVGHDAGALAAACRAQVLAGSAAQLVATVVVADDGDGAAARPEQRGTAALSWAGVLAGAYLPGSGDEAQASSAPS